MTEVGTGSGTISRDKAVILRPRPLLRCDTNPLPALEPLGILFNSTL